MQLEEALFILSRAHTQDDDRSGFSCSPLPSLLTVSQMEYLEAWEAVRCHLGQKVDPSSLDDAGG